MKSSLLVPVLLYSFFIVVVSGQQPWDDLNCAAPRSPKNGLSFIFKEGREVHFKCHPGFHLNGSPISRCINNLWDAPVPNCLPEKENNNETYSEISDEALTEKGKPDRTLFSWDSPGQTSKPSPEPGSRRLPLINGLWRPSYEYNRLQPDGIHKRRNPAANKTRDLFTQELGIAEVRHKQQMEVQSNSVLRGAEHFPRSNRPTLQQNAQEAELRRWRLNQARQSPNILYAGSRAASAYRGETGEEGDLEAGESVMSMFDYNEAPRLPEEIRVHQYTYPSYNYRSELQNPDLIELRQRQIAETLLSQMASNLQRGGNADKAGLVEDARRRQYEERQLLRNGARPLYNSHGQYLSLADAATQDNMFERRPVLGDDNDQFEVSGSELHVETAIPKKESSGNQIQLDSTPETIIFKPIAFDFDQESLEAPPYRGDMGTPDTMMDYTETYTMKTPGQPRRPLFTETSSERALFSPEKAGQVEATIRQFLRPRPQIFVHNVYPPPPVPTYNSHLIPRTTPRPVVTRPPRPTSRPVRLPPTRSPVMEANGEKAAQTEEVLYQQYLQAEHLRRIMEYERDRLDWERRQEWERRNQMMEEQQRESNRRQMLTSEDDQDVAADELVQRPEEIYFSSNDSDSDLDYMNRVAVLASIDREWLSQLSPDLQARYLEEILRSRTKESDESHHAEEFMRRYIDNDISSGNSTFPNVSTRTSASGHVTTIIQSQTASGLNDSTIAKADLSCLQSRSGRRLFIRAPKVPFAFVHRYERRKHTQAPYKPYLVAEYRCRRGFSFADHRNRSLFCRRMEWAGEKPECVKSG